MKFPYEFIIQVDIMGKDLKGRELGVGISQRKDGLYTARFVSKQTGKNIQKYFNKLQECRQWYADAKFNDKHGNILAVEDITLQDWFDYWFKTNAERLRPNTQRGYINSFKRIPEKYRRILLKELKAMHLQEIRL